MPLYPLIELDLTIGTWDISDWFLPDTGYDGGENTPFEFGQRVRLRFHDE